MISGRIKEPLSIYSKLQRLNASLDILSIKSNLNDVAGIQIICNYIQDIYSVRDILSIKRGWEPVREKDYIKNAKSNGYHFSFITAYLPAIASCNDRSRSVKK